MKNLIINLSPPGDVLRTTVLLRELEGENYWITRDRCKPVLNSLRLKKIYSLDKKEDLEDLVKKDFDKVINLNDEDKALKIVQQVKTKELIGLYLNSKRKIDYTSSSKYWFDMSLLSKFGKKKADNLKIKNRKSYPQILTEMIGKEWKGQEYDLGILPKEHKRKIGLIKTVTGLWPNKGWRYYDKLKTKLKNEGLNTEFLELKPTIKEHIEEVNDCGLVVCGDTLGMHISLALKKKVIALFNCTSPYEIYDYKRLKKIISPLYEKYFYKKEFNEESISAIPFEEVYSEIKNILKT